MIAASLPPTRDGLRFGVHTPLQDTSAGAVRALWRRIEATGDQGEGGCFDWISVWDHFGSLTGTTANLEAVAMHAALACTTERVRCACLVYSVGYRDPLQLASAIATIDQLSAGRATLGLGAGYLEREYRMTGRALPTPGQRAGHLGETLRAVRSLLDGETVTVEGRHVRLVEASCAPPPAQAHLPIIVGGGGERSTIPLAAEVADGWNVPMATPDDVARKVTILREHELAAGREPGAVETTVSIGLCFDETQLPARFGPRWEALRPAVCTGSTEQAVDLVGRYRDAGVHRVVLSLRAPFDAAVEVDLQRFAAEIAPEFQPRPTPEDATR